MFEPAPPAAYPSETMMLSYLAMLVLAAPSGAIVIYLDELIRVHGVITPMLVQWLILWPLLFSIGFIQWFIAVPLLYRLIRGRWRRPIAS